MIGLDDAFNALRFDFSTFIRMEQDRVDLLRSLLNPAMRDERDVALKKNLEVLREQMMATMKDLVEFPPQHSKHAQVLDQFKQVADFDTSVFVMTKFPNQGVAGALDAQLNAVITAVRDAVQGKGKVARLASDRQYHPLLWDNVELYLLGCSRGIAIVEDKYLPELNPNVSMEWGWMRGMGRNVLYLVEKDFTNQRADWAGLIERTFDWANPAADIKTAVEDWLK